MNSKKVLGLIIYLLACLVLWILAFWGSLITPADNIYRWLLQDAFQYFIPLVWILGTAAIIGERK